MYSHRDFKNLTLSISAVLFALILFVFGFGMVFGSHKTTRNFVEAASTSVDLPELESTYFDYTGFDITPNITYDTANVQIVTADSTLSATNEGEYTIVFELIDPANTEWANGHSRQVAIAWRIGGDKNGYYSGVNVWNGTDSITPVLLDTSAANSESNPYLIKSAANLKYVANNSSSFRGAYFKQTIDIDLNNNSWTPINTNSNDYNYYYDGNGHTISNISVSSGSQYVGGLFGYVGTGYIKNLGIESGSIVCTYASQYNSHLGGFIGYISGSFTFENCYNKATVSSTSGYNGSSGTKYIGGLVGRAYVITINNCYNTGAISYRGYNSSYVGGLVGYGYGTFRNVYNRADISGTCTYLSVSKYIYVGGIIGYNNSTLDITNAYNTGSVLAQNSGSINTNNYIYAGGIIGYKYSSATLTRCYNIGRITAMRGPTSYTYSTNISAAGLAGCSSSDTPPTVSNSYFNSSTSGTTYVYKDTTSYGLTSAKMTVGTNGVAPSDMSAFTESNGWTLVAGRYPALTLPDYRKSEEKISTINLTIPTLSVTSYEYGLLSENELEFEDFYDAFMSATLGGTNLGPQTVTISLENPLYSWTDGTNTDKTIALTITKVHVALPTLDELTYEWTGSAITPDVVYDDTLISAEDDLSGIDVGNYTITFTLNDPDYYQWADETTANQTIAWEITKVPVALPTLDELTYIWTGSAITPDVVYDDTIISAEDDISGTDAGSYTITFKIDDMNHYQWADGTTENKTIAWEITKKQLNKPEISGPTSFIYNGEYKAPTIINYDSVGIIKTGTEYADSAGIYQITYSLVSSDNCVWSDGTYEDVVLTWVIKGLVAKPSISGASVFVYDEQIHAPVIINYDENKVTQNGVTQTSNFGKYSITYSLNDPEHFVWSDSTDSDVILNWTIKRKLTKPTLSSGSDYVYDGITQEVVLSGFDEDTMNIISGLNGVNAGTYNVVVEIADPSLYVWADETYEDLSIEWKIKSALTIPTVATPVVDYNGELQEIELNNFDESTMEFSLDSVSSATDSGKYTVTIQIRDTNNYAWVDKTTENKVVQWEIVPIVVNKPVFLTVYGWTGLPIEPSAFGFDSRIMSQLNELGVEEGEYSFKIALRSTTNSMWEDETTDAYSVSYNISKAVDSWDGVTSVAPALLNNSKENSVDNPYIIESGANLKYVSDNAFDFDGKYLSQTKDINLNLHAFTAIGEDYGYSFNYNGNGHKVYGLKIANQEYGGLFGYISDSLITNLGIVDSEISATTYAGGIAAYAVNSEFVNVYNSAKVVANSNYEAYAGGIVGYTDRTTIQNAYNTGSVISTGNSYYSCYAGGLIGYAAYNTTLSFAYNVGFVNAENTYYQWYATAGGLVGYASGTLVEKCYFNMQTSGTNYGIGSWGDSSGGLITSLMQSAFNYVEPYGMIEFSPENGWKLVKDCYPTFLYESEQNYVCIPSVTQDFFFNGEEQTCFDGSTEFFTVDGTQYAIAEGTYYISFVLNDGCYWADGLTTPKTFEWRIWKTELEIPILFQDEYEYNPNLINELDFDYFYDEYMTATLSGTSVGEQTVTVSLKNSLYSWVDGSKTDKTYAITITKSIVELPIICDELTYEWTGSAITLYVEYNGAYVSVTGNVSATDVGSYTITFALINTENTMWADETTEAKTITWEITTAIVELPELSTTYFDYTGTAITPEIMFDTTRVTVSGDLSATEEGQYILTFTLKDSEQSQWSSGHSRQIGVAWRIGGDKNGYYSGANVWNGTDSIAPVLLDASASNSESNPYLIESAANLKYVSDNYNSFGGAYFKQTIDIDLNNESWTPINTTSNDYNYYYDGNGHTISNINVNNGSQYVGGLFGYVSTGYIKNLGIESGSIVCTYNSSADAYLGGFVGLASFALTMENCYNKATVSSTYGFNNYYSYYKYIGGLVGRAINTLTITNCYNAGDISYNGYNCVGIGGLVGQGRGTLTNVYNTGAISGICTYTSTTKYVNVGGFIGVNNGTLNITNAYNTGSVLAQNSGSTSTTNEIYAGGILGRKNYNVTLTRCYNAGQITAMRGSTPYTSDTNILAQAFVGYGVVTTEDDCYNNTTTSGTTLGYTEGLTTEQMQVVTNSVAPENMSAFTEGNGWTLVAGQYPTLALPDYGKKGNSLNLAIPTLLQDEYAYDPNLVNKLEFENFYDAYMTATLSGTNVGSQTVTISLKNPLYSWADGTNTDKVFELTVTKNLLEKPILTSNIVFYNASLEQVLTTLQIANFDEQFMQIAISGLSLGDQTITISLLNTEYSCWADGSTTNIVYMVYIVKSTVELPTLDELTYEWTGSEITPNVVCDNTLMSVTGNVNGTDVGSYTITFALIDAVNTMWADGTTEYKTITWEITKAIVELPTLDELSYEWIGSAITPNVEYNSAYISVTGNASATDVGSYTITFALIDTENTIWADETTGSKTITWEITTAIVELPELSTTYFDYTGTAITPEITVDTTRVIVSGDVSATQEGQYILTFTLKDSEQSQWANGHSRQVAIAWRIAGDKNGYYSGVSVWNGTDSTAPVLLDANAANSESNPYLIKSAANLKYVSDNYNSFGGAYFKQTINIDLNNESWTPINTTSSNYNYYYDGDGHTISNISVNNSSQYFGGLFGYVYMGYIKNLGIESGSIVGTYNSANDAHFGGFVGYIYGSFTLENCYNKATVSASGSNGYTKYLGGLVGRAVYTLTINNCYNEGAISYEGYNSSYIGGLVGQGYGTFTNVYNTGAISAICTYTGTTRYVYVGGIVGVNNGTLNITNAYNTGSVLAQNSGSTNTNNRIYAGGIIGFRESTATLTRCYNAGQIIAMRGSTSNTNSTNLQAAGLVGSSFSAPTIYDSYFNTSTSGTTYAYGTTTDYGLTTEQMKVVTYGVAPENMSAFTESNGWTLVAGQYPTLTLPDYSKKVNSLNLEIPTLLQDKFEYNPDLVYELEFENFYDAFMTATLSGTNLGLQTVTISLKNTGYSWADGTNTDKTITWEIEKIKVLLPTFASTYFAYTGNAVIPSISNFDNGLATIGGDKIGVEIGEYVTTFTLNDPDHYQWENGHSRQIGIAWQIGGENTGYDGSTASLEIPILLQNEYEYNPNLVNELEFENLYDAFMTATLSGTNVGEQTVTVSLKNSLYSWADGSNAAKTYTITITKAIVELPTLNELSYEWTGSAITPDVVYDDTLISVTGNTSGTNIGSYTITFTLNDTEYYQWADETIEDKTIAWEITKIIVALPTLDALTYEWTGSAITPDVVYDNTLISATDDLSGTNIGSYTITFTLNDTEYYQWADETIEDKTITWEITKAIVELPELSATYFDYTGNVITPEITVDTTRVTVSGDLSATDEGQYNIIFTLNDDVNMEWETGYNRELTIAWRIGGDKNGYYSGVSVWNGTDSIAPVLLNTSLTNSESNPYLIGSAANLKYVSDNYSSYNNAYFKQTINIDLNNESWTPINTTSSSYNYYYDGDGHTISNISVNSGSQYVGGLFGRVGTGYIKNLGIESGSIVSTYASSSNSYLGGFIGYFYGSFTFENCYNKATVSSTYGYNGSSCTKYIGGLVGYSYNGATLTIDNCYNTGAISYSGYDSSYIGGLVGYCYTGTFTNVYNTGGISGTCTYTNTTRYVYVGGIIGYNNNISITNGYNLGSVYAQNSGSTSTSNCIYAGGIIGYQYSSATFTRCYNAGRITAMRGTTSDTYSTNLNAAGLTGYNAPTIYDSYFNTETSGTTYAYRTTTNYGLTTEQMKVATYGVAPSSMSAFTESNGWTLVAGQYPTLTLPDYGKKVNSLNLEIPTLLQDKFEYNPDLVYEPKFENFYDAFMTSTLSGTNAGEQTVTISLKNTGYSWADGTNTNKTYSITINKKLLTKVEIESDYIRYTGSANEVYTSVGMQNFDEDYLTRTITSFGVGRQIITISIKDSNNFAWADESVDDIIFDIIIDKRHESLPIINSQTFEYTGDVIIPEFTYNEDLVTISGDLSGSELGTYTTIFSLNENMNTNWSDGSISNYVITWHIVKHIVANPTLEKTSYAYTGNEITPNVEYNNAYVSATDDLSGTDVGSYTITFTLDDPEHYQWADETTEDKTITWEIEKIVVELPKLSGIYFDYNGTVITPDITVDTTHVTVGGDSSATDEGEYTVTFTLNDPDHSQWESGHSRQIAIAWSIGVDKFGYRIRPTSVWNGTDSTTPVLFDKSSLNSESNPYLIKSAANLKYVSDNSALFSGAYLKQTIDIDLNNKLWTPINTTSSNHTYYYDGDGHTISNINVRSSSNYVGGLFAYVHGGYIKNLGIESGSIVSTNSNSSYAYLGGFVGFIGEGSFTFENCYNKATVYATSSYSFSGYNKYIGGLIGSTHGLSTLTINNCYNTGAISYSGDYSSYIGGLVGGGVGTFTNVYNTGAISGTCTYNYTTTYVYVGGIAGCSINTLSITNGYNLGSVYAQNSGSTSTSNYIYAGGICGYQSNVSVSGPLTLTRCYNAGQITVKRGSTSYTQSTNLTASGLAVSGGAGLQIYDSYFNTNTSGTNIPSSNGLTTAQMKVETDGFAPENMSAFTESNGWTLVAGEYPTLDIQLPNCAISTANLEMPTLLQDEYEYTLNLIEDLDFENFYDAFMTATLSETNAGEQTVTISLKNTGYSWADGTNTAKTYTITITKVPVALPTLDELSYEWTGSTITPDVVYDDTLVSANNLSGTNAGSYTITFILDDPEHYQWADGTTADKTITWEITKVIVELPTLDELSYVWTGSAITPDVVYDDTLVSATVDLSGTDAGSYTITFDLIDTDNTIWTDETTESKTITWEITKAIVELPTLDELSYEWTGSIITPDVVYDDTLVSATDDLSGTNIKSYTITFALIDTANTIWADGTTENKTITWEIIKAIVELPELSETYFDYTGSEITPSVTYDTTNIQMVAAASTLSAINEGEYIITFTLNDADHYQWENEHSRQIGIAWRIGGESIGYNVSTANLAIPALISTEFEYDENLFDYIEIEDFYDAFMTATSSGTSVGEQTIIISLKNPLYSWADGTNRDIILNFTVNKVIIEEPYMEHDVYNYIGLEIEPVLNGFNEQYMCKDGDDSGTDVGNYTLVVKLSDKTNFGWADGSSNDLNYAWEIANLSKQTWVGSSVMPNGEGTEDRPYLILSEENLAYVSENADMFNETYIKQMVDLDLTNLNWTPINNNPYNDFTVYYDGNYKKIKNLKTAPDNEVSGLFGYVTGGYIKNLTISSGSIYGTCSVGGIVGRASNTELTNLSNNAMVIARSESNWCEAGGIVGDMEECEVTNVRNTGDVTVIYIGTSDVEICAGGIAGYTYEVTITNAQSTGNVSGIINSNMTNSAVCVGGIIGYAEGSVSLQRVYFVGELNTMIYETTSGDNMCKAGLIGVNDGTYEFNDAYYLNTVADVAVGYDYDIDDAISGYSLTDDNMKVQTANVAPEGMSNFNATNGWILIQNNYPEIAAFFEFDKPTILNNITEFTYTGQEIPITLIDYIELYMNLTGDISATNTGTYTITISLKNSSQRWSDGSMGDVVLTWKINCQIITNDDVTLSATEFNYNNSEQKPEITIAGLVEGSDYEISFERNGQPTLDLTSSGEISIVITLLNDNYILSDSFEQLSYTINQTFTVNFIVNVDSYGTVNLAEIPYVENGSAITVSENTVTINGQTVVATATVNDAQYTYAFNGWTGTVETVTENITIIANFTRTVNSYTITFNSNGGTSIADQVIEYGQPVIAPEDPSMLHYTFVAWCVDDTLVEEVNFETYTVTGNATLYAKWLEDFFIYYQPMQGNAEKLYISSETLIDDARSMISQLVDIRTDKLTLLLNQTILSDGKTLSEYNIDQGSTIRYVQKGRIGKVEVPENFSTGSIVDEDETLISKISLTEEEQYLVETGSNIDIYVVVEQIDNEVSNSEKSFIMNALGSDQKLLSYVSINLYKKIGDQEQTLIETVRDGVEISLTIPDEVKQLQNVDSIKPKLILLNENDVVVYDGINAEEVFKLKIYNSSRYALIYENATIPVDEDQDLMSISIISIIVGVAVLVLLFILCIILSSLPRRKD